MTRKTLLAAATALLGALPLRAAHAAIEEPAYTVIEVHDGWELRSYAPTIQARVTVQGEWGDALNQGFRILAGYIFGGNQPRARIEMTAPVAARPAGERIAMTAPVAAVPAAAAGDGATWVVSFTMPSSWTLETLPVPDDPRVTLVAEAGGRVAALPFGGWATSRRVAEKQAELARALEASGFTSTGPAVTAQYNPPWTPPPLRRNEILVPVR